MLRCRAGDREANQRARRLADASCCSLTQTVVRSTERAMYVPRLESVVRRRKATYILGSRMCRRRGSSPGRVVSLPGLGSTWLIMRDARRALSQTLAAWLCSLQRHVERFVPLLAVR